MSNNPLMILFCTILVIFHLFAFFVIDNILHRINGLEKKYCILENRITEIENLLITLNYKEKNDYKP